MPMGTDPLTCVELDRRAWLQRLARGVLGLSMPLFPALAAAAQAGRGDAAAHRLVACWDDADGAHWAGWLHVAQGHTRVHRAVNLPTRGHGLARFPGDSLLVVARRPGDWLLRVSPQGPVDWVWAEPGRVFSGHVWVSGNGQTVFTTELDTETGNGLLGVRDARTLTKTAEWPTHGKDPHAVSSMPDAACGEGEAAHPLAGALFVANGGIDTSLETGRTKRHLHRMDPSVVCLNPANGEVLGQWRLADPRLSLRHLAWAHHSDGQPVLGIALQAEHDVAEVRQAAPLLAVLDWSSVAEGSLTAAAGQPAWGGYGGDVVAWPQGHPRDESVVGFALSATRGHAVLRFDIRGRYLGHTVWPYAGALAASGQSVWAGGASGVLAWAEVSHWGAGFSGARIDNHWIAV